MKKICIFVDRWMGGGIESYILNSLEKIDLNGLKIDILTTKKLSKLYDNRIDNLGIKIIELNPKEDSEITRLFNSRKKFIELVKLNKYDIVHLNIYNATSMKFAKISKRMGIKNVIVHSHNSNIGFVRFRNLKLFAHKLTKLIYQKYIDYPWACSDLAAEWMFDKKNVSSYSFIKNGIDTRRFAYSQNKRIKFREKHKIDQSIFLIGNIGRLSNQKNQQFILYLAQELLKTSLNFQIIIIGEGELEKELMDLSEKLMLNNKVLFLGAQSDVGEILSGLDLFILPSYFEGLPLAALEAQAASLTTLCSSTISQQVKLTDYISFYSIDSIIEWVNKIVDVYNTKELIQRSVLRGNESVTKEGFDINSTSQVLENNYWEILNE